MKAGTPVPDGMDYYDISEGYVAKGWARDRRLKDYFGDSLGEDLFWNEMERQGYKHAISRFAAEVYPTSPSGNRVYGYYCACKPK